MSCYPNILAKYIPFYVVNVLKFDSGNRNEKCFVTQCTDTNTNNVFSIHKTVQKR